MENNYLAQILPFLNEIEEERKKQFEEYFRTAPMWLMDTFVVGRTGKRNHLCPGRRAGGHRVPDRKRAY